MRKIVVVSLHVGYWLLYLLLLTLILVCLQVGTNLKNLPFFTDVRFEIFFFAFAVLPAILGFYSYYTLLFDNFLIKRKILLLFFSGVVTALACSLISACMLTVLHSFRIGPSILNNGNGTSIPIIIVIAIIALLNGTIGLIMKGFIRWYAELKLKEELTRKNFEMELALVKSQISPHFLFNTLNNIDVLITKNAEKASSYLNQLSDIMRFMLYETKTEKILLSKELAYVQKYVELQKIRTANPDFVHFSVEGETTYDYIAPMVIIPFVENAFKHTVNLKTGNAIQIKVWIKSGIIGFECENKYQESTMKSEHGGLGNELIKKRLELLYAERHTLEITKNEEVYRIKLTVRTIQNQALNSSLKMLKND
ncbi:sensor histidine kinase [Runella sp.]|uniref:sensor histidine kinase n=1 Tax=Runella sp. TaxID=1960881 RepID=UPI003D12E899